MDHIDRINAIIGEEEKTTYLKPVKIFPYKTEIKTEELKSKNYSKCYNCTYYTIYNNTDRCIVYGRLNSKCENFRD